MSEDTLDELSEGELRRLMLHLDEANGRLRRAREILDENELIEGWDGSHGWLYDFIDAHARVDAGYRAVWNRHEEEATDDE